MRGAFREVSFSLIDGYQVSFLFAAIPLFRPTVASRRAGERTTY